MGRGNTFLNAVIGAVVTVVLSFTGFSPLLGGAVSGYLQQETRRAGAKVGALSGVLALIPVLVVLFFLFAVVIGGSAATGQIPVSGGAALVAVFVLFFLILLVWNVGLSALGGYLGAILQEETGGETRQRGARPR